MLIILEKEDYSYVNKKAALKYLLSYFEAVSLIDGCFNLYTPRFAQC